MMLSIQHPPARLCDGISRREWMRVGMLGLAGAAGSEAFAASNTPKAKAKSCIVLFLVGGAPQYSTWDPKPHAPAEIRGAYGAIPTAVPGIHIGELLGETAKLTDQIALLRAVSTNDNAHSSSGYWMLTGRPHQPLNFENANPGAPNNWPSLGAIVQHLHRTASPLPTAMRLPHHIYNTDLSVWPGQDSGFLGLAADPWLYRCQPAAEQNMSSDLVLSADLPMIRLASRRNLLQQLESSLTRLERTGQLQNFKEQQAKAFDMIASPQARRAFNLADEPNDQRDRYGRHPFGQSVLLARRLVEAGVSWIQVNWYRGADEPNDAPCWDTHVNEAGRLKTALAPPFDQAYSALLRDLIASGRLSDTLVVCMAEFGRSPRVNRLGGRDHWGHVFSVALAGGGIRGGVVHGSSDGHAAYPQSGLVHPQDLSATIFHCLGFDPNTTIHDRIGRPAPISSGRVIHEILG